LLVAAVSRNGYALTYRSNPGAAEPDILAETMPRPPMLTLPINVLVIDRFTRTAHFAFEAAWQGEKRPQVRLVN
jgi:hypothetical protein